MMTLEKFKEQHKNLIDLGVCSVEVQKHLGLITIAIDRFDGENFLCEYDLLKPAQADARKMGFLHVSTGLYWKRIE
jgi:hypothetical protein